MTRQKGKIMLKKRTRSRCFISPSWPDMVNLQKTLCCRPFYTSRANMIFQNKCWNIHGKKEKIFLPVFLPGTMVLKFLPGLFLRLKAGSAIRRRTDDPKYCPGDPKALKKCRRWPPLPSICCTSKMPGTILYGMKTRFLKINLWSLPFRLRSTKRQGIWPWRPLKWPGLVLL